MGLMTSPGRRWVWYGGRPSLDFVNTRRNREAAGGTPEPETARPVTAKPSTCASLPTWPRGWPRPG